MKLTYATVASIPSGTANSVQIMKMCDHFNQLGCAVELVLPLRVRPFIARTLNKEKVFRNYNCASRFPVRTVLVPDRSLGIRLYPALMMRSVRRRNSDVVYTRDIRVAVAANDCAFRTVFETHEYHRDRQHPLFGRFVEALRNSPYLRLVAISNVLKEAYLQDGVPEERILVAHDGVDRPRVSHVPGTKVPFRDGRPVVGYVGSLYEYKGIRVLIDAAKMIPEAKFVVVGGSPDEVCKWEEYARDGNVDNVTFLGRVPHAETFGLMSGMDVLTMPYTTLEQTVQYMSPLKMFEYMATGKPIVASNLPTVAEVLRDGENAVMVPPDDPDSLAKALRELISDPGKGRRLGMAAQRDVEGFYWDVRAERIIRFIREQWEIQR